METRNSRSVNATVLSGAAISGAIDNTWAAGGGFVTPATLTATTVIAFKVSSAFAGTYVPLYDKDGALVEVAASVAAAGAYPLPDELFAFAYFKLWTEAAGVDVNQAADRAFVVTLKE